MTQQWQDDLLFIGVDTAQLLQVTMEATQMNYTLCIPVNTFIVIQRDTEENVQ